MAQTNTVFRKMARLLSVSKNEAENGEDGFFGLAPSMFDSSYLSDINISADRGIADSLPVRYDLRDSGMLTPVKNQGYYGTCWAHATLASLESGLLINGKGVYDLSEKNLAMLHGGDWMFDDGGNADRSSAYLLRWAGPALEAEDPYPSDSYYLTWFYDNHYWSEGLGKWIYKYAYAVDSILPESLSLSPAFHVQNVRWIPKRNSYLDNDVIKEAVATLGALHVSYYHSDDYYEPLTASYYNSDIRYIPGTNERKTNHAVALVGWDDNYSAKNFSKTPPGNGAFIVRNSWGTNWGDGGYFYVSYYDESFAWNTLYNFSNVESADNYDAVYEYDPLGLVTSVGYGSVSAWGANMFQATSAAKISAVGFYALTPNTTYTIYVYTGSTAGSPRSGTLTATQSGKSEYAGYVTVPLSSTPSVSSSQRFSVVVQLATPGYNYPLAYEYAYPGYTSEATASAGESFLSSNGTSWSDFTKVDGSANFCCKAYTKSATAAKATLSSIAIAGVSSLTPGKSATFTCEATYSDGAKKTVSPTWSLSDGKSYATISSSGVLTAKEVTAAQTVKVKASYTEDGITKTAEWGLHVTVAAPAAPTGVTATQGTEASCVRLNWAAPSGATEYSVFRSQKSGSAGAWLGNVTTTKYSDTEAVPGVDYWYTVKAKNSSGISSASTEAQGWRKLSPPESVNATDTLLDKVAVSWTECEGAKYYRVYRSDDMDDTDPDPISGWMALVEFDDTSAVAGTVYYYFVVAAVDASGSRPSDFSIIEDGMRAEPVKAASLAISGAASIASGASATYTAVATYTDGTTKTVSPSWSIVSGSSYATLSGATLTAKTVAENKTVKLKASYSEDGTTVSDTKSIAVTATIPATPTGLSATSAATGITLKWTQVAGAQKYNVYRAEAGGTAAVIGVASSATYTDTTATPGQSYVYCVSAVNGAGEGEKSSTVSSIVALAAPTGVTATSDHTDGVLVTWSKVNGASHYRVARSTSASGTKTQLGSWSAATTYTDTSATAGTKYWYFVRAATSSSGANASAYSASAQGLRKVAVTLSSVSISGADKVVSSKTALYTCTATYSDGSTKTVTPVWSATPESAATIGVGGLLTAKAVSADATVAISASFTDGTTKTATKSVTIIAPARATAEIRNVSVASRWPFSPLLDIDYELVSEPASAKAAVSVYGRDEDHGVDMAAATLSGDGADGAYIAAGQHRLIWDIGVDYPGFHATAFSVTMTATPSIIGVPENVTASASTSGVTLNWNAVEDATGYEVWRGTGATTNGATRIATVTGATTYFDGTGTAGTTYRYWLRASGEDGVGEFAQPVAGTRTVIVPVSLAISGASSVTAGDTATYSCTVTRNDGTGGTVAPTWSVASGSEDASISSSGVLTANGTATQRSVTIQASWTENGTTVTATSDITINTKSVTISFDGNGGSVSSSSQSYTAYGTYGTLPTATRTGWTFDGWFTASSGGTQVTEGSTVPASATTLYAHWTEDATQTHGKVQLWEGGPYWATTNIGADNPEDYGYYFWWGDTVGYKREDDAWVPSDGKSWMYSFEQSLTPTDNKSIDTLKSGGWIVSRDGKYVLAPKHDAAQVHWGGEWRMPTISELFYLGYNCDWTWTTQNGVNGYIVRGKGDYAANSIFLPAAGYGVGTSLYYAGSKGYYQSSVPIEINREFAYLYYFDSGKNDTQGNWRYFAYPVRPVQGFAE